MSFRRKRSDDSYLKHCNPWIIVVVYLLDEHVELHWPIGNTGHARRMLREVRVTWRNIVPHIVWYVCNKRPKIAAKPFNTHMTKMKPTCFGCTTNRRFQQKRSKNEIWSSCNPSIRGVAVLISNPAAKSCYSDKLFSMIAIHDSLWQ